MISNNRKVFLCIAGILSCLLGVFVAITSGVGEFSGLRFPPSSRASLAGRPFISKEDVHVLFEDIARDRMPAVVQLQFIRHDDRPFGPDVLEDFFLPDETHSRHPLEENGKVVGTGFIIREDGYIVTTGHMMNYMDEVHVILSDETRMIAEVVGMDPVTDVAVLKVDAFDLPVMPLAESPQLKQGQWVMSIGTPMGDRFNNTVTLGIVSSVSPFESDVSPGLQFATDVAMSYGNSGGPLIDIRGQLIGMANVPYAAADPFNGFAFAIPVQRLQNSAEAIIARGEADRGRIGVRYRPLAVANGLPEGAAYIIRVEPGSAAERAGIKSGDVILSVDGAPLMEDFEFSERIAASRPGDFVTLTIQRDSVDVELEIEVQEERVEPRNVTDDEDPQQRLMREMGFTVDNLNEAVIRDLEVPVRDGVVVLYVNPSSVSYRQGDLRGGMIIVEMADKRIRNRTDFMRVYSEIPPGMTFLVLVHRPQSTGAWLTALTKPE